MDARDTQKEFLNRVEQASGKPVIVQSDPKFSGHATIKIAKKDQAAHVLLYKPQHESVLPYLVAYQCSLALRTLEPSQEAQFELSSRSNMEQEVLTLIQNHIGNKPSIPSHLIPQLAGQFGNGLGWQLRSMPIAIRVDRQIHDEHPELRELQRRSVDGQLQENMHALSPRAKELAPKEIIDPNASMNAAFAKFWSDLWHAPMVYAPYLAAGYNDVARELLRLTEEIPSDSSHDRELVEAWMNSLGLDRWFQTKER